MIAAARAWSTWPGGGPPRRERQARPAPAPLGAGRHAGAAALQPLAADCFPPAHDVAGGDGAGLPGRRCGHNDDHAGARTSRPDRARSGWVAWPLSGAGAGRRPARGARCGPMAHSTLLVRHRPGAARRRSRRSPERPQPPQPPSPGGAICNVSSHRPPSAVVARLVPSGGVGAGPARD